MKRTGIQRRTPIRAKAPIRRKTEIRRTRMKRARPVKRHPHVTFCRKLPCIVCLGPDAEAAHVRFSDADAGKVNPGMGRKDDRFVVPLCAHCHRTGPDAQHKGNERDFWRRQGIDVLAVCRDLFACGRDIEAGERIIRSARDE